MTAPLFHSSIEVPLVGVQERDHHELEEMKKYLLSCLRMDAYPETLKVTARGLDITPAIGRYLTAQLRKPKC